MKTWHIVEAGRIIANIFDDKLAKWAAGAFAAVWSLIEPSQATAKLALAISIFVSIDMVTGVRVSIKRKRYLTSKLWNRIVDKVIAYGSLVLLASLIPRALPEAGWLGMIGNVALIMAAYGEIISILENLSGIGISWASKLASVLKVKVQGLLAEDVNAE